MLAGILRWAESMPARIDAWHDRKISRVDAWEATTKTRIDRAGKRAEIRTNIAGQKLFTAHDHWDREIRKQARLNKLATQESRAEAKKKPGQGNSRPYSGSSNYRGAGSRYMASERRTVRFTDTPAVPKKQYKPREERQSSWL